MSAPRIKESPLGTIYIFPDHPITLARPRFANGHAYDSQKKLRLQWQQALSLLRTQSKDPYYIEQPLSLSLVLLFALPKRLSRQRKMDLIGKPHTNVPDASNCQKWVEDVAEGILYANDKCIVETNVIKLYAPHAVTAFRVTPYNPDRISPSIFQFVAEYKP